MTKIHTWIEGDKEHTLADHTEHHNGHTLILEKIVTNELDQSSSVTKAWCKDCKKDVVLNEYYVKII